MEFVKGMDISFLPEEIDRGAIFYDELGNVVEPLQLLKDNGVNSIRLRLWNEPKNYPESGGYCDLAQTIAFAKKIKEKGMSLFLNFHYSDWWADPGQQRKPKAWENLSFEELEEAVYSFTKSSLETMKSEGVYPEIVQIGNEIRSGMIFPEGEVPNYAQLVRLVNSGIRAVRETGKDMGVKIVIHLDQGGRYYYLRDWFDAAIEHGLEDFDIIGLSYYPFWHGTFAEFKSTLEFMVERYQKPVMIAEAAHPWRCTDQGFVGEQQEKIIGFPATPKAQHDVIDLIMNITSSLKNEMGLGIYYWEPVVLPKGDGGGWSENMGIFAEDGKPLDCLKAFRFQRSGADGNRIAKIYEPKEITIKQGMKPQLPEQVKVLYYDGRCILHEVQWDTIDTGVIGLHNIEGRIQDMNEKVTITVSVVEKLDEKHNYILNGGFDHNFDDWKVDVGNELVKTEIHPEFVDPFPAPPIHHVFVEGITNFTFSMEQEIVIEEPGEYGLYVEYKGTNTTGVEVSLYCREVEVEGNEAEEYITWIHPTDDEWVEYEISPMKLSKGKIQLGILMKAPPVYGRLRRFRLTRIS